MLDLITELLGVLLVLSLGKALLNLVRRLRNEWHPALQDGRKQSLLPHARANHSSLD